MKAEERNTLEGFVRHAEHFGTECVFETAATCLGLKQLGYLSLHLQRIDVRWSLKRVLKTNTGDFAAMLVDRGISVKQAAEMAQVSTKTVREHHNAGLHVEMDLETTL